MSHDKREKNVLLTENKRLAVARRTALSTLTSLRDFKFRQLDLPPVKSMELHGTYALIAEPVEHKATDVLDIGVKDTLLGIIKKITAMPEVQQLQETVHAAYESCEKAFNALYPQVEELEPDQSTVFGWLTRKASEAMNGERAQFSEEEILQRKNVLLQQQIDILQAAIIQVTEPLGELARIDNDFVSFQLTPDQEFARKKKAMQEIHMRIAATEKAVKEVLEGNLVLPVKKAEEELAQLVADANEKFPVPITPPKKDDYSTFLSSFYQLQQMEKAINAQAAHVKSLMADESNRQVQDIYEKIQTIVTGLKKELQGHHVGRKGENIVDEILRLDKLVDEAKQFNELEKINSLQAQEAVINAQVAALRDIIPKPAQKVVSYRQSPRKSRVKNVDIASFDSPSPGVDLPPPASFASPQMISENKDLIEKRKKAFDDLLFLRNHYYKTLDLPALTGIRFKRSQALRAKGAEVQLEAQATDVSPNLWQSFKTTVLGVSLPQIDALQKSLDAVFIGCEQHFNALSPQVKHEEAKTEENVLFKNKLLEKQIAILEESFKQASAIVKQLATIDSELIAFENHLQKQNAYQGKLAERKTVLERIHAIMKDLESELQAELGNDRGTFIHSKTADLSKLVAEAEKIARREKFFDAASTKDYGELLFSIDEISALENEISEGAAIVRAQVPARKEANPLREEILKKRMILKRTFEIVKDFPRDPKATGREQLLYRAFMSLATQDGQSFKFDVDIHDAELFFLEAEEEKLNVIIARLQSLFDEAKPVSVVDVLQEDLKASDETSDDLFKEVNDLFKKVNVVGSRDLIAYCHSVMQFADILLDGGLAACVSENVNLHHINAFNKAMAFNFTQSFEQNVQEFEIGLQNYMHFAHNEDGITNFNNEIFSIQASVSTVEAVVKKEYPATGKWPTALEGIGVARKWFSLSKDALVAEVLAQENEGTLEAYLTRHLQAYGDLQKEVAVVPTLEGFRQQDANKLAQLRKHRDILATAFKMHFQGVFKAMLEQEQQAEYPNPDLLNRLEQNIQWIDQMPLYEFLNSERIFTLQERQFSLNKEQKNYAQLVRVKRDVIEFIHLVNPTIDVVGEAPDENVGFRLHLQRIDTRKNLQPSIEVLKKLDIPLPTLLRINTNAGSSFYLYGLALDKKPQLKQLTAKGLDDVGIWDQKSIIVSPIRNQVFFEAIKNVQGHIHQVSEEVMDFNISSEQAEIKTALTYLQTLFTEAVNSFGAEDVALIKRTAPLLQGEVSLESFKSVSLETKAVMEVESVTDEIPKEITLLDKGVEVLEDFKEKFKSTFSSSSPSDLEEAAMSSESEENVSAAAFTLNSKEITLLDKGVEVLEAFKEKFKSTFSSSSSSDLEGAAMSSESEENVSAAPSTSNSLEEQEVIILEEVNTPSRETELIDEMSQEQWKQGLEAKLVRYQKAQLAFEATAPGDSEAYAAAYSKLRAAAVDMQEVLKLKDKAQEVEQELQGFMGKFPDERLTHHQQTRYYRQVLEGDRPLIAGFFKQAASAKMASDLNLVAKVLVENRSSLPQADNQLLDQLASDSQYLGGVGEQYMRNRELFKVASKEGFDTKADYKKAMRELKESKAILDAASELFYDVESARLQQIEEVLLQLEDMITFIGNASIHLQSTATEMKLLQLVLDKKMPLNADSKGTLAGELRKVAEVLQDSREQLIPFISLLRTGKLKDLPQSVKNAAKELKQVSDHLNNVVTNNTVLHEKLDAASRSIWEKFLNFVCEGLNKIFNTKYQGNSTRIMKEFKAKMQAPIVEGPRGEEPDAPLSQRPLPG